jgi:hypothetical protein
MAAKKYNQVLTILLDLLLIQKVFFFRSPVKLVAGAFRQLNPRLTYIDT